MKFLKIAIPFETKTLMVGPVLLSDGTPKTTGITAADIEISKNGSSFAAIDDTFVPVHDGGGWWQIRLNENDINQYGVLELQIYIPPNGSIMVPFFDTFWVLPIGLYNMIKTEKGGWIELIRLHLVASGGYDALLCKSTDSNTSGIKAEGLKAGLETIAASGSGGTGHISEGDGAGQGQYKKGGTSGYAELNEAEAGSDNAAIYNKGNGSGPGVLDQGGLTSGDGHQMVAGGGNANGLTLGKQGTGKDLSASEIDSILADTDEIQTALPAGSNPDATKIAAKGDLNNLQNNTKVRVTIPSPIEIPDSGDVLVPVCCTFYDASGVPTDPDNNEISVQGRAVNQAAYKDAFFDDEAGTTGATASLTFTPNYWKMVRLSQGNYQTYYKMPSTEVPDTWQFNFRLEEGSVTIPFCSNISVTDVGAGAVLSDNQTNYDVISKSLKQSDVSAVSTLPGSIIDLLNSDKLTLATTIDGMTLEHVMELAAMMADGRLVFDEGTGLCIGHKRDNTTELTRYTTTKTERTRG
jgi:hypothetical protein